MCRGQNWTGVMAVLVAAEAAAVLCRGGLECQMVGVNWMVEGSVYAVMIGPGRPCMTDSRRGAR